MNNPFLSLAAYVARGTPMQLTAKWCGDAEYSV